LWYLYAFVFSILVPECLSDLGVSFTHGRLTKLPCNNVVVITRGYVLGRFEDGWVLGRAA
jgi:hypothetical protein